MTHFITVNTVGTLKRLINVNNIVMLAEGFNGSTIYLSDNLLVETTNSFEDIINRISSGLNVTVTEKIK
jgi:hypothetical protein